MKSIKKKYIVDENNKTVAVQLDIETFNKIEEALENYALYKLINENDDEDKLSLSDAREYYKKMKES